MRALVQIGNYEFPAPSTYVGTTATIVDSARNTQGYVVGSVIRNDVAKIELTWRYVTAEDWALILQCFSDKHGGSFYRDVTFLNQVTNQWETRTFYVNDRKSSGIFLCDEDTGKPLGWKDCALNLIER